MMGMMIVFVAFMLGAGVLLMLATAAPIPFISVSSLIIVTGIAVYMGKNRNQQTTQNGLEKIHQKYAEGELTDAELEREIEQELLQEREFESGKQISVPSETSSNKGIQLYKINLTSELEKALSESQRTNPPVTNYVSPIPDTSNPLVVSHYAWEQMRDWLNDINKKDQDHINKNTIDKAILQLHEKEEITLTAEQKARILSELTT